MITKQMSKPVSLLRGVDFKKNDIEAMRQCMSNAPQEQAKQYITILIFFRGWMVWNMNHFIDNNFHRILMLQMLFFRCV